jgi:hypothetical protein
MPHSQTKRIGMSNRADYNNKAFFQQAPAKKVKHFNFQPPRNKQIICEGVVFQTPLCSFSSEHLHAE